MDNLKAFFFVALLYAPGLTLMSQIHWSWAALAAAFSLLGIVANLAKPFRKISTITLLDPSAVCVKPFGKHEVPPFNSAAATSTEDEVAELTHV